MLALIAHDKTKPEMLDFVRTHLGFLRTARLVATNCVTAREVVDWLQRAR